MSSQEDISDNNDCPPNGDIFKPKKKPKAVRVLTVMAYVLSVSMAAILLSIYYIFMWEGRPHIGALSSRQTGNESLMWNNSPIDRHGPNYNFTEGQDVKVIEKLLFNNINSIAKSADVTIVQIVNNIRNAAGNQTSAESEYPTDNSAHNNSTGNYNTSGEHDLV